MPLLPPFSSPAPKSAGTPATFAPGVAIVGGGPAGLMAATVLAEAGIAVDLFDAMPSVGRKFLLAGRGGLNLTHSEPLPAFIGRYGQRAPEIAGWLRHFSPEDLRRFSAALGVETFVGSSGRVFPVDFKAARLLRSWLQWLRHRGVRFHMRHRWQDFTADGRCRFATPAGEIAGPAVGSTVLALGGASWPKLGGDGAWTAPLAQRGIGIAGLRPANCGFNVAWSAGFLARAEGQPLKSLAVSFNDRRVRGELVVSRYGLEGGPLYALSGTLRDALCHDAPVILHLDLKPDLSLAEVQGKLFRRGSASLANALRKTLGLGGSVPALLREFVAPAELADPAALARAIKALPVPLTGLQPIERAISSAGGIVFAELGDDLMLRRLPGVFVAGEMLDWEAPTGGYLLQGAFASGYRAGHGARQYLCRGTPPA